MKKIMICAMLVLIAATIGFSQRRTNRRSVQAKPKPIVFAVTDDGKMIEPIGVFDKGELKATTGGDGDPKELNAFAGSYYKPKTSYSLIFGGAANGTVTVKNSKTKSECAKNMADVTTASGKAKLKGVLMALATNQTTAKSSGVRRLPTAAERSEIETLVRAEFAKQNVSESAIKNLKYHNLTALDVDNDGKAEMVGSFWVEGTPKTRDLLFFIAEKDASGKYVFGHSEYKKVTSEDIMGGADITALDSGTYNELLLDTLAYDGDKTAEIFTVVQGFEGNSFNVYSKRDGKWTKVFEGANYHCAF